MKTRRYCQTVVVFSFLGTLSRTVANPLPESYEEPNYLTFFNEGDLGFSGPPVDDMGQSNTEEQLIFPDSAQPWNTFSSSELYENPGFPEEDNPLYSLEQNQDLLFASSHSHDTIIPDWNTMDTSESLEQPADRFAAFDSDPTVADSDWISMDTSKIAWGGGIKPPYCGATETPVCCYNRENWTGCTYCKLPLIDPTNISLQVHLHLLRDHV
jgi:hypothetical protein